MMKNLQARMKRIENSIDVDEKHLVFGIKFFEDEKQKKEEQKRLLSEHFKKHPEDEKATRIIFVSDFAEEDPPVSSRGFLYSYTPVGQ